MKMVGFILAILEDSTIRKIFSSFFSKPAEPIQILFNLTKKLNLFYTKVIKCHKVIRWFVGGGLNYLKYLPCFTLNSSWNDCIGFPDSWWAEQGDYCDRGRRERCPDTYWRRHKGRYLGRVRDMAMMLVC